MEIKILRAGPLTTVQDEGRFGYMEYGIGQSGVMDGDAYQRANALVGNKKGEAVLEATLMGPSLWFADDTLIAFMGADMQALIDGKPAERGKAHLVKGGQTAVFGMARNGIRCYIAVAGGIDVPRVMGSRSTDMKCKLGGFEGRRLADGDVLGTIDRRDSRRRLKALLKKRMIVPEYASEITVRVIQGPQDDCFTEKGLETFFQTAYTVSSESDRMGIRLVGEAVEGKGGMDIVSDGIAFGSVQVTTSGLPIILTADHQTTGGYAKIATVISADLPLLAQAGPGTQIRFQKTEVEDAQRKGSFWERKGNPYGRSRKENRKGGRV